MHGEGRERLNFFRKTILRMARSWAKIPGLPWAEVEASLFSQCPTFDASDDDDDDSDWSLNENGQHAVLALGIYFLESGGQHADKILPYLLSIESNLPKITILDKKSMNHRELNNFWLLLWRF